MTIKIVITGDNHLNYYSRRLGSKLAERRAQIGGAWRETIDFAIHKKADLYLVVGDLFDQISPRNPPRSGVIEAFVDLKEAGIKSFVIAGTHDAPSTLMDGASPHLLLQKAGLATVFEDPQRFGQEILEVDDTRISIAGISTDRRLRSNMDPLDGIIIPGGADFNIAMLHYSIEMIAPPYWEEPMIRMNSLERNKHINLFAVGHIHRHITKRLGNSLILYSGATEHFDFGESESDTGFSYVEVEGKKMKVDYIKTKSQPMTQLRLHTSKIGTENSTGTILEALVAASDSDSLLQLILEGELRFDDYLTIDFLRLFDEGKRRNFYFEYLDNIQPIAENMAYQASSGLQPRNELLSVANQAIEEADSKERRFWKRALELAITYYDRHSET